MPSGQDAIPALALVAIGACMPLGLPDLPTWRGGGPAGVQYLALMAGVGAGWLAARHRGWRLGCLCALGCLWGLWAAAAGLDHRWPDERDREVVEFDALVLEARGPTTPDRPMRLLVRPIAGDARLGFAPPRIVRLGVWPGDFVLPVPAVGDCLRLSARLRAPSGHVNPGGLDAEARAVRSHLDAVGTARQLRPCPAPALPALMDAGVIAARWRDAWRDRVSARLAVVDSAGTASPAVAVLDALLTGRRYLLPESLRDTFQATGTSHLFSVSGMHVAAVAAPVVALSWLPARLVALGFPLAARCLPALASTVAAAVFALLAGGGAATCRATVMCVIVQLGALSGRQVGAGVRWSWALVITLTIDPLMSLDVGAWLSFTAVAVLLLVFSGTGVRGRWSRLLVAQAVLMIALAPFQARLGGDLALASIPANLMAVPAVTLCVLPGALLGALLPPDLGIAILSRVAALVASGLDLLSMLAQAPALTLSQGLGTGIIAAPLVPLVGLVGVRALPVAGVLVAALLMADAVRPPSGAVDWQVLDVGHGTAVLLRDRAGVVLVDTGDAYVGGPAVRSALRASGWPAPELIIVSHADADHAGGLARLLRQPPYRPLTVLTPWPRALSAREDIRRAIARRRAHDDAPVTFAQCRPGTIPRSRGVSLRLHNGPPSGATGAAGAAAADRNADSCVVEVVAAGFRMLIPGDIDAHREYRILSRLGPVDVLISPHHGSGGSSARWFVERTRPGLVIHSTPFNSPYGHPHPDVVARYRRIGAVQVCTGASGAVSGRGIGGEQRLRRDRPRWWHRRPVCRAE